MARCSMNRNWLVEWANWLVTNKTEPKFPRISDQSAPMRE